MKERPILFSGEMVRAILDGRKTQTRRVIKPQPPAWAWAVHELSEGRFFWADTKLDSEDARLWPNCDDQVTCPYGVNGDRLWVKENWWRHHLPRWASRITLEIESVRVERVQEITRPDVEREGLQSDDTMRPGHKHSDCYMMHRFAELWDRINSKRGFGWDANPWVWVINFRRCK